MGVSYYCFGVRPASSVPTSIPRPVHSENPIAVLVCTHKLQVHRSKAAQGLPLQPLKPFGTVFSFPFLFFPLFMFSYFQVFLPRTHAAGVPRREKKRGT